MNPRLPVVVCLLVAGVAVGQYAPPPRLPSAGASPLTFVRFTGPTGMKTTFYQGRARPRSFPTPAVVGLRPGYLYRVQLSEIPGRPGLTLFPTVEVRGSLKLRPNSPAHNFPATIHLSQDDIEAVLTGSLITKVIYLEHPDRAEPQATQNGQILEFDLPRNRDLYTEARQKGRIILVVHFGERVPTDEELVRTNIPGTILHPNEKVVGPAVAPPCLPLVPRAGEEECLHDGGDRFRPVGFDTDGEIGGLDPEDTVAEYRDSSGRRQLVVSNRVCICVPRFVALRKECPLARSESVMGPLDRKLVKRDALLEERVPSRETAQTKGPRGLDGRMRPSVNLNVQGLGLFSVLKVLQAQQLDLGPIEAIGTKRIIQLSDRQKAEVVHGIKVVREFSQITKLAGVEQILHTSVVARVKPGAEIVSSHLFVRDLTVCCNEAPIPPERPLVLIKCADASSAKPGDVITFTLRYSNHGGRAMTDVAVADSLSGRLEYVEGSAESDRDAVFTVQQNEAGSQILRWEVTGTLQPGDTGRVRFKARVR